MAFESLDFVYHPSRDVKRDAAWPEESKFEIPHGPICSFHVPGGQRVAVYQLTRPGAAASFEGRREF